MIPPFPMIHEIARLREEEIQRDVVMAQNRLARLEQTSGLLRQLALVLPIRRSEPDLEESCLEAECA